ncbi:MAG: XdhC family protein [Acidobacteriaceae bacterium]|nr:XdhC family protein [Acidobacteriaceae bacterium]
MRERRKLVELWKRGDAVALATLVRVEGSSYRRPGARLLIGPKGEYAGAISGGCLEAEVLRRTQWKVRSGAVMERYSTLFDDAAEIPYGLGCGGVLDLLLEPAQTPECHALLQALEDSLHGKSFHVETELPEQGGVFRRTVMPQTPHTSFSPLLGMEAQTRANRFLETLLPPLRLVVCGAGDDAQPLVRAAASMGWRVAVVDGRAHWARTERFPEAESVGSSLEELHVQPQDAVAVMTHSYEQDRKTLCDLLPRRPLYLGLLGSRHRSALLLAETAATLSWPVARACDRVFAPMGLNIGGDGAESIALATVAEIQACLHGRLPQMRRMTEANVAEQVARGGSSRYLQTQCAL